MIATPLASSPPIAVLALLRLPSLWVALGLLYAGIGALMAWHLGRLGHELGTSSMALLCWPLLLGLVGRPPPSTGLLLRGPSRPGPNSERIEACMASLRRGLLDDPDEGDSARPLGSPLIDQEQLHSLAQSLHRADRRIARVDRLLRETDARELAGLGLDGRDNQLLTALSELRSARTHAQAELESVLSGLLSLRVQLGMFALAGEVEPVRERLAEFEARVAALAELSSIELAQVHP